MLSDENPSKYIVMPEVFMRGCSNNLAIFTADGGNHFTDYGIFEGMFLFFDTEKPFKQGCLSCFENELKNDNPPYKVSDTPLDGYKHFGRLVVTIRNYEETLWKEQEEKFM